MGHLVTLNSPLHAPLDETTSHRMQFASAQKTQTSHHATRLTDRKRGFSRLVVTELSMLGHVVFAVYFPRSFALLF